MAGLNDYPDNYPYINNYWDAQDPSIYQYMDNEYLPQDEVDRNYRTTRSHSDDEAATLKKFIGTGVGIVSLIAENLLSHPFVVLRRQCQVHNNSYRYHLIPISLVPVICHLHKRQGVTTLWKGLGSALLVRGMTLGIEDLLSKITPWPKEISWNSSIKSFFQHTFLKSVSLALIMPFYSASLVETVQSDIASEKPGILDVFREGAIRLLNWGGNSKGRMLPMWALVLPTVTLGLARYFFSLLVQSGTFRILQIRHKQSQSATGTLPKTVSKIGSLQDIELTSSLVGVIAADVLFYPFETILHRLYLQGTRTIVDDLDSGKAVLPILTNYHGPVDCYESCINTEGVSGLYKGFGALILQYAAHILVIRITKFILTETSSIFYKPHKSPVNASPLVQQQHSAVPGYSIPL